MSDKKEAALEMFRSMKDPSTTLLAAAHVPQIATALLVEPEKKWKYFDITKDKEDGTKELYLRRFFIDRDRKFGNIFLHNILLCDKDRDPHTHPWKFTTLILSGGYTEETWDMERNFLGARTHKAGDIVVNPLSFVHQIKSVEPNTWTLVITGAEEQEWGFITENGWVFWREYLDVWEELDMD